MSSSGIVPVGSPTAATAQAVQIANTYGAVPLAIVAAPAPPRAPAVRPEVGPVDPIPGLRGTLIDVYA